MSIDIVAAILIGQYFGVCENIRTILMRNNKLAKVIYQNFRLLK